MATGIFSLVITALLLAFLAGAFGFLWGVHYEVSRAEAARQRRIAAAYEAAERSPLEDPSVLYLHRHDSR